MITSDLTIDLIPSISLIREETRGVIGYSRVQVPSVSDVLNIAYRTLKMRKKWQRLVTRQSATLQMLMTMDFTKGGSSRLKEIAESIEGAVTSGRELLAEANQLGAEIRFWWRSPLRQFAQQIEHFDSIAESLRLECEPEVTMLLARAASHIVAEPRSKSSPENTPGAR
ncbi:MAG TPA: hypothetical protein VNY05_30165 [Candidatus Acidoferrales bacterium]|jgi:hypothetical protein|nr:hypothetical protein [Candidatus Acidoferrales bacterium]